MCVYIYIYIKFVGTYFSVFFGLVITHSDAYNWEISFRTCLLQFFLSRFILDPLEKHIGLV